MMQMPMRAPLAPMPPSPPPTRAYVGLRTGIVLLVVVAATVLLAGLLPGSVVTARNLAYPQPNISVSASTAQVHVGDSVQFSVSVKAGNELTYSWDFGDGAVPGGATMSHTYDATCQSCAVTVTATDPIQHQARATTQIVVAPPT
ncbi:MAG: PKD domain-containing protein, partial [Ktedonobacterales bacterium]